MMEILRNHEELANILMERLNIRQPSRRRGYVEQSFQQDNAKKADKDHEYPPTNMIRILSSAELAHNSQNYHAPVPKKDTCIPRNESLERIHVYATDIGTIYPTINDNEFAERSTDHVTVPYTDASTHTLSTSLPTEQHSNEINPKINEVSSTTLDDMVNDRYPGVIANGMSTRTSNEDTTETFDQIYDASSLPLTFQPTGIASLSSPPISPPEYISNPKFKFGLGMYSGEDISGKGMYTGEKIAERRMHSKFTQPVNNMIYQEATQNQTSSDLPCSIQPSLLSPPSYEEVVAALDRYKRLHNQSNNSQEQRNTKSQSDLDLPTSTTPVMFNHLSYEDIMSRLKLHANVQEQSGNYQCIESLCDLALQAIVYSTLLNTHTFQTPLQECMLNRSAELRDSTSNLKALPGKLDTKRHSTTILYLQGQSGNSPPTNNHSDFNPSKIALMNEDSAYDDSQEQSHQSVSASKPDIATPTSSALSFLIPHNSTEVGSKHGNLEDQSTPTKLSKSKKRQMRRQKLREILKRSRETRDEEVYIKAAQEDNFDAGSLNALIHLTESHSDLAIATTSPSAMVDSPIYEDVLPELVWFDNKRDQSNNSDITKSKSDFAIPTTELTLVTYESVESALERRCNNTEEQSTSSHSTEVQLVLPLSTQAHPPMVEPPCYEEVMTESDWYDVLRNQSLNSPTASDCQSDITLPTPSASSILIPPSYDEVMSALAINGDLEGKSTRVTKSKKRRLRRQKLRKAVQQWGGTWAGFVYMKTVENDSYEERSLYGLIH